MAYFSRLQLQYDLDLIKEKEGAEVKKVHEFIPVKQLRRPVIEV